MSPRSKPNSARTSSVCWPWLGAERTENATPGTDDRVAEREESAEDRMILGDDLSPRLKVGVALDLVEPERGPMAISAVDGDLHPLGLGPRVEHPLDLEPELVLRRREVHHQIAAVLAQQVVPADSPAQWAQNWTRSHRTG